MKIIALKNLVTLAIVATVSTLTTGQYVVARVNDEELKSIRTPNSMREAAMSWLKENAPKSHVEVLGRHMMFWEDSEAFNKVLSDFPGRSKNEQTRSKK